MSLYACVLVCLYACVYLLTYITQSDIIEYMIKNYKYIFIGLIIIYLGFGLIIVNNNRNRSFQYGIKEVQPTQPTKYPTGYQIWDEANKYRLSQGKKELELWDYLCNNIAERAINYEKTNSHLGLEEFKQKWMPQINSLSEILITSTTAEGAIKGWSESPSHNLALLNANRGCAYSSNGYSVMLLSK